VVFIARGESARHAQSIAGMLCVINISYSSFEMIQCSWALQVDSVDDFPLYLVSLEPNMNKSCNTARLIVSIPSVSYASDAAMTC
jgi:hypothetical protein